METASEKGSTMDDRLGKINNAKALGEVNADNVTAKRAEAKAKRAKVGSSGFAR